MNSAAWLVLCVAGGLAATAVARADTTIIRELAKGTPKIVILVSGAQAAELAKAVQGAIIRQPDNKKRTAQDIPIIPLAEATEESVSAPKRGPVSLIILVVRKEWHGAIPDFLSSQMPVKLAGMAYGDGALKSEMTSSGGRGTAFTTMLVAPDDQRLRPLCDKFIARSAARFNTLPFALDFHTYRVAVFSTPEDKPAVEGWGRVSGSDAWSDARWYPLTDRDKLKPEDLEEYNQAYFINRAQRGIGVPECAAKLLAGRDLKETTSFVRRDDLGNGCSIAVFSTPNSTLLAARAHRYSGFRNIPDGLAIDDVKDLRHIGRTTLLISGAGPGPEDKEAMRLLIARAMRHGLNMPVEERGEVLGLLQKEVTLEELQGATGTADMLRRKGKLRHIWLFTILEYSGGTEYTTGEQKLREDTLVPYETAHGRDDPEPQEPVRKFLGGGGDKKDVEARHPQWEIDHHAWTSRKVQYEERETSRLSAQFERHITSTTTARVRGVLRLIDLQDQTKPVEVVWDYDCRGVASSGTQTLKRDTVTVAAGRTPNSLESPPNNDRCPAALLQAAAVNAASIGLMQLRDNAWLPDGTLPEEVAVDKAPTVPPDPIVVKREPIEPAAGDAQVAAIENAVVTVTIGAANGVRLGDRVQVLVETKEVKHPTTGKVLETRVIQSVLLRVTRVGVTADCVPLNPQEAAKINLIKIGLPIRTWHAARISPQKTGKQNGKAK